MFWPMDAMSINVRGSALHVEGYPWLVVLCIATLDATSLSVEKYVNLKALKIMCPLVGEEDLVLASCPKLRKLVARVGSEGCKNPRFKAANQLDLNPFRVYKKWLKSIFEAM